MTRSPDDPIYVELALLAEACKPTVRRIFRETSAALDAEDRAALDPTDPRDDGAGALPGVTPTR